MGDKAAAVLRELPGHGGESPALPARPAPRRRPPLLLRLCWRRPSSHPTHAGPCDPGSCLLFCDDVISVSGLFCQETETRRRPGPGARTSSLPQGPRRLRTPPRVPTRTSTCAPDGLTPCSPGSPHPAPHGFLPGPVPSRVFSTSVDRWQPVLQVCRHWRRCLKKKNVVFFFYYYCGEIHTTQNEPFPSERRRGI